MITTVHDILALRYKVVIIVTKTLELKCSQVLKKRKFKLFFIKNYSSSLIVRFVFYEICLQPTNWYELEVCENSGRNQISSR